MVQPVAGWQSSKVIHWSDDFVGTFQEAHHILSRNCSIALFQVICFGKLPMKQSGSQVSVSCYALPVATSFTSLVSFSAKPRGSWLPCEVEVLFIAIPTEHFSPYVSQSHNNACILTDRKPCMQAFEKLYLDEFSTSLHISTFLPSASCFQASMSHISGFVILPSDSSWNSPPCQNATC